MVIRLPHFRGLAVLALGAGLCLFGGTSGGLAGSFCKLKVVNNTTSITVPDHSTSDNTPVVNLRFKKDCLGAVIGTLTVEIDGHLHLHEAVAECLSSGGFPGGCKPGDKVDIGYPAIHRLLESDGLQEVTYPLVTTRLTWPKVAPGEWRFRVLPGCISDCPVTIWKTWLTLEAYGD
jgi:hypothetical protein